MGTTSKVLACLLACLLAAESRMRGDLHVRFGGQGDLDPTIIMLSLCYLD